MTRTAAEAIAEGLAAEGCRHAYGMPGGEVLVLLEALEAAGIGFTLCKHENAAGFMAEGSWQATGAPGILLTTIGPGLANGVNSIANAYQEQVPLIVLSGCIGAAQAEQFTHQVIDQSALLAPITKARFTVAEGTAALVVEKALSIALADPPGPVHIDLPDTLAKSESPALKSPARVRERPLWPEGDSRRKAGDMLARSRRPLVLAGIGAVLHGAGPALRAFCERHGAPILTTYKAKGVVDEHHPLALGGHGLSPLSDKTVLPLIRQADCIILAGFDPIEMRADWMHPFDAERVIELAHAPVEHGMFGSKVRFVGDVAAAVAALDSDQAAPLEATWPGGEPAAARAALDAAFAGPGRWGPHAVFRALNETLPENGVMTVDSGAHRILMAQMTRCRFPGRLLQSAAFCTMGVAVPLAMGRAHAEPGRPVAAVVGDAGFDMIAGELATLRDLGLSLPIVVLVDKSLALIARKQTAMQLPRRGVDFGATDFAAVARAYGGHGTVVKSVESLQSELSAAWGGNGFRVIACPVDKRDYDGAF